MCEGEAKRAEKKTRPHSWRRFFRQCAEVSDSQSSRASHACSRASATNFSSLTVYVELRSRAAHWRAVCPYLSRLRPTKSFGVAPRVAHAQQTLSSSPRELALNSFINVAGGGSPTPKNSWVVARRVGPTISLTNVAGGVSLIIVAGGVRPARRPNSLTAHIAHRRKRSQVLLLGAFLFAQLVASVECTGAPSKWSLVRRGLESEASRKRDNGDASVKE